MHWVITLYSWFGSVAIWFYQIATDLKDQWWCPSWLSSAFNSIGDLFREIYLNLISFAQWVWALEDKITNFLTRLQLDAIIATPLAMLSQVWNWFIDRVYYIRDIINTWWVATSLVVLSWIDVAKASLQQIIATVQTGLNQVSTWWGDFVSLTLPTLLDISWLTSFFGKGIASIGEWFTTQKERIEGWIGVATDAIVGVVNEHSDILDIVTELFTNPVEWLKTNFLDPIIEDFNRGFDRGMRR